MAVGNTITDSLADSLPTVNAQARVVRKYSGVMTQIVDRVTLGKGTGLDWREISLAQLTAQNITETTEEDNPQQLSDSLFTVTPSMISVHTVITDRVALRISQNVFAKTGSLGQQAIETQKDKDGLTVLDGATTSLAGTGTTLTSGHIAAAAYRIRGNTVEPWAGPVAFVLHSYQMKDLFDELVAGVGTYDISQGGLTAEVFKNSFMLPIANAKAYTDDNITIDSTPDAKGGVFASGANGAIVLVQGRAANIKTIRNEKLGGGATEVLHRDEYAYGERSPGNWLYEILSDATAPTS
jgi:hypothetical protein